MWLREPQPPFENLSHRLITSGIEALEMQEVREV